MLQRVQRAEFDTEDVDLVEEMMVAQARASFWAFRQYMFPDMIQGWWQNLVSAELQKFYDDLKAGKRPVLLLQSPPQHGKSRQVTEFLAWVAGKEPDWRQIFASFSSALGLRTNMQIQRMIDSPKYKKLFPDTNLSASNVVTQAGRYQRNSELLEFVGKNGSFRNTTVEGAINGEGLDLGVVDDPIKGRKEARSPTKRNSTWDWLTDDFMSRFSKSAGMIMIMTRWHVDDPAGRWIKQYPKTRVLRFPAIAVKDEKYRKKGEALFPEHKPADFLLLRKGVMSQAGWESVYQQSPIIVGGGMFPIDKFGIVETAPHPRDVKQTVRYWDKAGTAGGGAHTAGVLLHELKDGRILISDVKRGQWSSLEREIRIKQAAEMDRATWGVRLQIWVEQEPGSGGKESAERTILNLKGFIVKADAVRGDKELRADPYSAQVQAGNVFLLAGKWNQDFIDEHETFPNGKYKDQVDAAGGAFTKATQRAGGSYDTSYSWVNNQT